MSKNLNIPQSVGIIMDGNRRWARAKGLPLLEGHRAGMKTLEKAVKFAKDIGVKNIIFYTFSTENWNRAKEEVDYLMNLFRIYFGKNADNLNKDGAVIKIAGSLKRFAKDIQENITKAVNKTKNNKGINVYFALNYGGKDEILSAVREIVKKNPKKEEITEEYFAKHLQTHPMPDPEIIIRTSGEKRLSNFLPWQSVYSELFFIEKNWPDFDEKEFKKVIEEYNQRERRMGK